MNRFVEIAFLIFLILFGFSLVLFLSPNISALDFTFTNPPYDGYIFPNEDPVYLRVNFSDNSSAIITATCISYTSNGSINSQGFASFESQNNTFKCFIYPEINDLYTTFVNLTELSNTTLTKNISYTAQGMTTGGYLTPKAPVIVPLSNITDMIIAGASVAQVLIAWNPEVAPQLKESAKILFVNTEFKNLIPNFAKTFSLLVRYLFREPASLVPTEVIKYKNV